MIYNYRKTNKIEKKRKKKSITIKFKNL